MSRRYSKAPITEAIIELRVQQLPGITVGDLLRCHLRICWESESWNVLVS